MISKRQNTRNSQSPPADISSVSDAVLLRIFAHLPSDQRRRLPTVCKRWSRLCSEHGELWAAVKVPLGPDFLRRLDTAALYRWVLSKCQQEAALRHLEFELASADGWAVVHGLLGVAGRRLRHLRVGGDGDEACYEPGGRAAWLELVPHLGSLELENAADWTIGACHFPAGLTSLELNYCGDEGLPAVPEGLGELTALASLSLQGSQFDGQPNFTPLMQCPQLQRLILTDCCLEEVPRGLSALADRLTSLTLNSNSELGGEGQDARLAPLASLTRLMHLEMRECSLSRAPGSITGLGSLRTLLLGYNTMVEPPYVPPGPYLEGLEMLGLSDCCLGEAWGEPQGKGSGKGGAAAGDEECAATGSSSGARKPYGAGKEGGEGEEASVSSGSGEFSGASRDSLAAVASLAAAPSMETGGAGASLSLGQVSSGGAGPQSEEALARLALELEGARAMQVLRINRNLSMRLAAAGLGALLAGKPRFRRLEYSAEMLEEGLGAQELAGRFPGVSFRAVD